jgi:putative phosphoribosyl transferase
VTTRRFAGLADAGRQLSAALRAYAQREDVLLLGLEPHGLVVAEAAAAELGLPVAAVNAAGEYGVALDGRTVILVDDGVESGATASRLGALLRAAAPERLVLAVPVCPREPYAALLRAFDEVVALERPLMIRSLAWHYATPP